MNSGKCLNKIKGKENIYIYIRIIKSAGRKVTEAGYKTRSFLCVFCLRKGALLHKD